MQGKIHYEFTAELWRHGAEGGWVFLSLPTDMSKEIRDQLQWQEEGWGRMKVVARIGSEEWGTAIWFDSKKKTYLLPVKADIRKKAKLELGQMVDTHIFI